MDKVRNQIIECDFVIGDISFNNPNVFYEIELAHVYGKPVMFITHDEQAIALVDARQFEFIHYELGRHSELISALDNAIQSIVTKEITVHFTTTP